MEIEYSTMTLRSLADRIAGGDMRRKPGRRYGFANTLVTDRPDKPNPRRWGPPPREFISPFPGEMAWIFSEVVKATNMLHGYTFWKDELFGRLGNAGKSYLNENPQASRTDVGLALVLEALVFVEKMESPDGIDFSLVTVNAAIVDDEWDRDTFGISSRSALERAWRDRGLELH